MKLLTAGGFLYSAVMAQNGDGTSGTYEAFDWVAMFPEGRNIALAVTASNATDRSMDVGWSPMVTGMITTYDGGKAIAGFGRKSSTLYAPWIAKMWGTHTKASNKVCAANASITGYVQMLFILNSELVEANCTLTANAHVQWAWTSLDATLANNGYGAGGNVIGQNLTSRVFLDLAEDWFKGDNTLDKPNYWGFGGATSGNLVSWGLLSWSFYAYSLDADGVVTGTPVTNSDFKGIWNSTIVDITADFVYSKGNNVTLKTAGVFMGNACISRAASLGSQGDDKYVIGLAGNIVLIPTCPQLAADGFSHTGTIYLGRTGKPSDWSTAAGDDSPLDTKNLVTIAELDHIKSLEKTTGQSVQLATGNSEKSINLGSCVYMNATDDSEGAVLYVITASQYYTPSTIMTLDSSLGDWNIDHSAGTWIEFATATYGQLWAALLWTKDETGATTLLKQTSDRAIIVGSLKNVGTAFTMTAASTTVGGGKNYAVSGTALTECFQETNGGVSANNRAVIKAPTGGMGQFKGLGISDPASKYNDVICKTVQPFFVSDYPKKLYGTDGNGWIIQCYTGIAQCVQDMSEINIVDLTSAEAAVCLNDPRYQTWRAFTIFIKMNGSQMWYRTDSYWNSAATSFCSTMGTMLQMSTSPITGTNDNSIAANASSGLGQTYVFAYGDGSGVQLNHIAVSVGPHASDNSPGSGTNNLTTSPTEFTNSYPKRVSDNYCSSSNLKLAGTSDTSSLSSTITAYSDGYQATLTMELEMLLTGAAGGWRGVCMVYYSSQYVMDNTNGAMCYAAQTDTQTGAGPTDYGAGYLMNVAPATWQPPAERASLTPSSSELTGGKYEIKYVPSGAVKRMYTLNFYSSVSWYQPKYASSYNLVARYGKSDYVGAYCIQGSGSNSYFSAPSASIKLTGGIYMAVTAISIGAALSMAM